MGDLVDSIFVRSPARSPATVSPAGIGERDKVAPFGGIALPFSCACGSSRSCS
jgi:hypothetical protein